MASTLPVEEPSPTTYDVCQKTAPFPTLSTPATNLTTNRPAPSKPPENGNPRFRLSSLASCQPPPPPGQSQPTQMFASSGGPNPSTQSLTPITHWATSSVGSHPLSSPLSQNTSLLPLYGAQEDALSSGSNESLSLFRRAIPCPTQFASSPNLCVNRSLPGQIQPAQMIASSEGPKPSTHSLDQTALWANPSGGSHLFSSPHSQNTSFLSHNGAQGDACSSFFNESGSLFLRTIPPPSARLASSLNLPMNPSPTFSPPENQIRLNTQPLLNLPPPSGMTQLEQPIASSEGAQPFFNSSSQAAQLTVSPGSTHPFLPPHPQHIPFYPPMGSWGNFSSPFSCESSGTNFSVCTFPTSTLFSNPLYQTVDSPNFSNVNTACANAPCTGVQPTTHAYHVSFHPSQ